jgi:hypothetical protein
MHNAYYLLYQLSSSITGGLPQSPTWVEIFDPKSTPKPKGNSITAKRTSLLDLYEDIVESERALQERRIFE